MENASAATKTWAHDTKANPLPFAWLLSCFISVVLPLFIFLICHRRYALTEKYDDDNNSDKKRDDDYSEQSLGALIFVYLWTLISFLIIVYFGNQHIRNAQESDRSFLLMLGMFANLSFVACILSVSNMQALDGHTWDGRYFSLFPSMMAVTYALWAFLCAAFGGVLCYNKYNKMKKVNEAYQRQTDAETPAK